MPVAIAKAAEQPTTTPAIAPALRPWDWEGPEVGEPDGVGVGWSEGWLDGADAGQRSASSCSAIPEGRGRDGLLLAKFVTCNSTETCGVR